MKHFLHADKEPMRTICVQGKRVLELGCGCGLVGLCYAAHGAHVLLTDLPEPLVLHLSGQPDARPSFAVVPKQHC